MDAFPHVAAAQGIARLARRARSGAEGSDVEGTGCAAARAEARRDHPAVAVVTFTSDTGLAAEIAGLVNRVYAEAEKGIWADDAARTSAEEIAGLIRAGEIAVVRSGERVVGS